MPAPPPLDIAAVIAYCEQRVPKAAVARTLRIGRTTLYRHLASAESADPRNQGDVSREALEEPSDVSRAAA